MIIPMVCFTCGCPIAHLYQRYLELVKEYEIADQHATTPSKQSPEFRSMSKLNIWRECCRKMCISEHDMYLLVR